MEMRDLIRIVEAEHLTGDLYHGTSVVNAGAIVEMNVMLPDESHDDKIGISFSRSPSIARTFAIIAEKRELETIRTNDRLHINTERLPGQPSKRGALLVFDGAKLRHSFPKRLQHYKWNGDKGEYEERLFGEEGFIVDDFLKGVLVSEDDLHWWEKAASLATETFTSGNLFNKLLHYPNRRTL